MHTFFMILDCIYGTTAQRMPSNIDNTVRTYCISMLPRNPQRERVTCAFSSSFCGLLRVQSVCDKAPCVPERQVVSVHGFRYGLLLVLEENHKPKQTIGRETSQLQQP